MTIYDIILLVLLGFFIFRGLRSGFITAIGRFVGIVVGAWVAGHFYEVAAQWLIQTFGINLMLAIVLGFIGLYLAVNIVVAIISLILNMAFKIIPLATLTNRIIGGLLGLLEGVLLIGLIIWVIALVPFDSSFTRGLQESRVAIFFKDSSSLVQPLLPEGLRTIDFNFLSDLQNFGDDKARYLQEHAPRLFNVVQQESDRLQQQLRTTDTTTAPTSSTQ